MLIGLVGKPSVGKSTFFKAVTLAEVEIASYSFTTIKANHGVGYVKIDCIEKEFNVTCEPAHGFCLQGKRFVPVEIMDVAGLVRGASQGKGLGNQFLDDLRQADAFIHIVDASGTTDSEGKLLPGASHNPTEDVEMLESELNTWYVNIMKKAWKTFSRKTESEKIKFSEAIAKQFSGLKVDEYHVKEVLKTLDFKYKDNPSRWNDSQITQFASALRQISKPTIIAANKADTVTANANIKKLKDKYPNFLVYPCSADSELALREATKHGLIEYVPGENDFKIKDKNKLNEKQKTALENIKKNVLDVYNGTGVQEAINVAVFDLLKYIAIFPAGAHKLADSKGRILPDCFLLPQGSTALDFAYYLHTDFGNNFIKAIDARTKKVFGKSYKLKNRDALEIVTK